MSTAVVVTILFSLSSVALLIVYCALLLGARCENALREQSREGGDRVPQGDTEREHAGLRPVADTGLTSTP